MLHPLVQENYYLRQRVQELEREVQHIRLMLAAKTLMIGKLEIRVDSINLDQFSGTFQIGVSHSADLNEGENSGCVKLPHLPERPVMEI
ncbi:hypothetical protein [Tumebacillus flagellatus]|uniref:Uncharacterized protein n=1 Tax=Tumebacillus flagellatus TaxID=1157490 RepID=A0A074LSG1_9BACL|nr:hypothetical protein [Tumebacillus flagellatus]KEO85071.1 hypothetical protein EL26_00465 [Tumebacillus flagellatus]